MESELFMERLRLLLRLALVACVSIALGSVARPAAALADPSSTESDALVDVGGHRLYVHCMGRGGPTVILEAGLGNPSGIWDLVQPTVAGFTTVCSYDRAGRGQSDPGPTPRTSQTVVDELRALLQGAGIRGPYVLVGHSVGGWHSQLFARQDGGRSVTGMVLVDATPLDWPQVTDSFGLPTPTPSQNPEGLDIRASAVEVLAEPELPNIPLVTLGRTVFPPATPPALVALWQERQVAYATLSCRGEFVTAAGAGHFIHRDRPDLVITAIERVVQAAHPTNAQQLHPTGHALPATHEGDAEGSRWDHCPS
jgi:pimeloyl-ACP methyl ester carboxylesterase